MLLFGSVPVLALEADRLDYLWRHLAVLLGVKVLHARATCVWRQDYLLRGGHALEDVRERGAQLVRVRLGAVVRGHRVLPTRGRRERLRGHGRLRLYVRLLAVVVRLLSLVIVVQLQAQHLLTHELLLLRERILG